MEPITSPAPAERSLSITYLFIITTGVAVSFAVTQAIKRLRHTADVAFYAASDKVESISAQEMLVAALYGTCLVTCVLAWRSRDPWQSPGKVIALIFAVMCVLDWTIEIIAASIMYARMHDAAAVGLEPGYILSFWYRSLAPSIGYPLALPIIAFIIYKTRHQRFYWRMVWIGFLISDLFMIGLVHTRLAMLLPITLREWLLEFVFGIPTVLIVIALAIDLARRQSIDWWTSIIAPLGICIWASMCVLHFITAR